MSDVPDEVVKATLDAMVFASIGEMGRAMDAFDVLADSGSSAIYGALCAWSETVRKFGFKDQPGFAVIDCVGPGDIDDAPRGAVWAARFVAAYMNDDKDTTMALFLALDPEREPEMTADAVGSVLDMAASSIKAHADGAA